MSIIRTKKNQRYTVVDNAPMQNKTLSWEARGMLAYLLTKPDNWSANVQELIRASPCGRDKTYRIVNELIGAGHLQRSQQTNSSGTYKSVAYDLYESPLPENPHTENAEAASLPENPHTENAEADGVNLLQQSPLPENPPLISTDLRNLITVTNTEGEQGENPPLANDFELSPLNDLKLALSDVTGITVGYSTKQQRRLNEFSAEMVGHVDPALIRVHYGQDEPPAACWWWFRDHWKGNGKNGKSISWPTIDDIADTLKQAAAPVVQPPRSATVQERNRAKIAAYAQQEQANDFNFLLETV